ncbi:MAG: aminopeptidase P family protein [Clostridia bacterium]|nr:aminopeptidase P family protein [Clostridia bacterium]
MKGKFEKIKTVIPEGCDGILLTSEVNQFYATGFPFTDGYVLVTRDQTYLVTDFRYIEAAQASEGVVKVELKGGVLGQLFSDLGIKALGFEDLCVTVAGLESFKNRYPGISFVPIGAAIDGLREFKDDDELDKIAKAQSIADAAFEHILGFISTDKTEKEIALELEFYMRSHGAENVSFETIAVSGPSSSMPHGVPADIKVRKGFLTMDFGCKYMGYCSDMTRTVVVGRADKEMKKLYNTVKAAQEAALAAIAPGVDLGELDKIARDIIDVDYNGAFGHSLGHGVGLYIHEAPGVSARSFGKKLQRGHVITVEPGIYLSGKYGCRIEDMVLYYADGCRDISASPKNLIEI